MNDRRAWKNKGAVESERRMDERIKALAARERALQPPAIKVSKERKQ